MAVTYGLTDGRTHALLYMMKAFRVLTVGISIYAVDKVLQASYVDRVFVKHQGPPSLITLPLYAMAAEGVVFIMLFSCFLAAHSHFKSPGNAFVIDDVFLSQAVADYALTTACILSAGVMLAAVLSNCTLMRYNVDGLRGIRTMTTSFYWVAIVILALPCYAAIS